MNIDVLRDSIDNIDEKIISLLEKRFELSVLIGKYKKNTELTICDSNREEEIINNIKLYSKNYNKEIEQVYTEIFLQSKKLQI